MSSFHKGSLARKLGLCTAVDIRVVSYCSACRFFPAVLSAAEKHMLKGKHQILHLTKHEIIHSFVVVVFGF